MLSIGSMSGGQEHYYLALARESYYLEGGEPPGRWMGTGCERLNLRGVADAESLQALFRGQDLEGKPLVQNAAQKNRQPGWDLTFSAPKSVSTVWSQAPAEIRQSIQLAHYRAVETAIAYLEEQAAYSRTGKGGHQRIPAGLVVATFEHGTSRALDPQLHTHALVLNLGVAEEGKTRTILSKPLYDHKMSAGAVYRAELAHQLHIQLGLVAVRKKNWFELNAVPDKLAEHFSKRRRQIETFLQSSGLETASAAAFAALATREVKDLVPPRSELFPTWKSQAEPFRFTLPTFHVPLPRSPAQEERLARDALQVALENLSLADSHFSRPAIVAEMAREACSRGLSARTVLDTITRAEQDPSLLIPLRTAGHEPRFTTPAIVATEKQLLTAIDALHQSEFVPVDDKHVRNACEKKRLPNEKPAKIPLTKVAASLVRAFSPHSFTLSEEQAASLRYLTQSRGRVKVLGGLAGTGKTTTLQAMREVFEGQGFRTIGCTPSAVAATRLQDATGIASETLRLTLLRLYPSLAYTWKHHLKQLWRTFRKKPTYAVDKLSLDSMSVVVLDEAGMVGTKDLELLVRAVREANAVLVLVGDEKQLPSIQAGGAFHAISKRCGASQLTEITRQRDPTHRQAVTALAHGKTEEALVAFAEQGLVTVADHHADAQQLLIRDWATEGVYAPEKHVILAATRHEVTQLNELAQQQRLLRGVFPSQRSITLNGTRFYIGDRILCEKNARALGVRNGNTGIIVGITGIPRFRSLVIKLDDQDTTTTVPLRDYQHFALGYAVTTHKKQGSSVTNSYVHLSSQLTSREMTYVQASRHKHGIRLYADQRELGEELQALLHEASAGTRPTGILESVAQSPFVKRMKASRAKQLAHEVSPSEENTPEPWRHHMPTEKHSVLTDPLQDEPQRPQEIQRPHHQR